MDPRGFTVRPCPGPYADKSQASLVNATSGRRDFFNSIGKIGDLEVLNSVGGGAIGTGLRVLASTSNSIRTGCGALPSVIGDSLDQGANWILDQIGIAPTTVQALQNFHPEIANQAWGQAKQVFDNVKNGHFKVTDIPSVLQDFQNLERLAQGIYTPGNDRYNKLSPVCEASPYAVDLIARAPKFKFLFVVQFVPTTGYAESAIFSDAIKDMAFVVKKSTRPKINYKTEDVNFYNFRSKVITKAEFEDMTMSFHDDIGNNSTLFYTTYIQAMSPITNLHPNMVPTHDTMENQGMSFGQPYAASTGPVKGANNKQSVFKEIILYHVYDYGQYVNAYHFLNPRITQLTPDEVDMSIGNEGNQLEITYAYDSVYVETQPIEKFNETFIGAQSNAVYQLRNNIAGSKIPNTHGDNPYGPAEPSTTSCNPMNPQDTKGTSDPLIVGGGFGGAISNGLGNLFT